MQATINSIQGRLVSVTFTFDDNSTMTKTMDLQLVGRDVVGEDGISLIETHDPFDDLQTFFKNYATAYLQGKTKEEGPPQNLVGTTFILS